MSNTVQNGKGSARRPGDRRAFERNFERIKWASKRTKKGGKK